MDEHIEEKETKDEILHKLRVINEIHNDKILRHSNYLLNRMFHDKFGRSPIESLTLNNPNFQFNLPILETLSFYFLNVLKNKEKENFYMHTKLKDRIDWIFIQFEKAEKHAENPSLAINFYDLEISGVPKDHLKSTFFIILGIIVFLLAYKYKLIKM